jgi:hypothetical protein
MGGGSAPEIILGSHETARRAAHSNRDLSLFILRLPRVVRAAGIRREVEESNYSSGLFFLPSRVRRDALTANWKENSMRKVEIRYCAV